LGTDYTTLAPPRRDTDASGNTAILRPTILHRGTLICGAALALACSNPYQTYAPADTVPVSSVKVTPQTIVLVAIGQTKDVTATIAPANATDQIITWESTDPTVVSVDAYGRVTARAVGSGVIITAITHDGHYQSSANVSVNP
jgi:uncharacterized protein YjdB